MADEIEQTLILVKPDGVQRGFIGTIIKRFERKGFKLVALKLVWPSKELLQIHYSELSAEPYFPSLIDYMSCSNVPVVAMVCEGPGAIKSGRQIVGATNPADSSTSTIRGDLCIQIGRNIIHGSDSVDSARKEINLWFSEQEIVGWTLAGEDWINRSNILR